MGEIDRDLIGLSLTNRLVTVLYAYFGLLLLGSLSATMLFIQDLPSGEIGSLPLWPCALGAVLTGVLGASVYYIRKIYKQCIRGEIEVAEQVGLREVGAFAYFVFRPPFAAAFSILAVLAMKGGNKFISLGANFEPETFVYSCLFIGFFCGFAAGRVLTVIERRGAGIDVG